MRKITKEAVRCFFEHRHYKNGNTSILRMSDDTIVMILFSSSIATMQDNKVVVNNGGWFSNTTKERLNGFPFLSVVQRKGEWYLNGVLWDGTDTAMTIKDQKLHNYNGPAITYPCGKKCWYVNGKELDAEFYSKEELYEKYPELLI